MKAIVQDGYGPPVEVLRLGEIDLPELTDDGVFAPCSRRRSAP
jgi:hypothetical protein